MEDICSRKKKKTPAELLLNDDLLLAFHVANLWNVLDVL